MHGTTIKKKDVSKLKPSELLECDSTVIVHLLACVISRFHLGLNEICALLGSYAVYNGNFVLPFRDKLSAPIFKLLAPEFDI
jgi:hypothetical protein